MTIEEGFMQKGKSYLYLDKIDSTVTVRVEMPPPPSLWGPGKPLPEPLTVLIQLERITCWGISPKTPNLTNRKFPPKPLRLFLGKIP